MTPTRLLPLLGYPRGVANPVKAKVASSSHTKAARVARVMAGKQGNTEGEVGTVPCTLKGLPMIL